MPSNDIKTIMGYLNLNAKVDKEEVFLGVIGKHSLHDTSNENGESILH